MSFKLIFRIQYILFLFFLIFTAPQCFPVEGEITMLRFISLLKEHHPYFLKEGLYVDIEKQTSESYLGDKDWNLSLTPAYSHLGEVSASEYSGAEEVDSIGVDLLISRKFWATGGALSFGLSSSYVTLDFPAGPFNAFVQGINVSYTQPLLQNLGGTQDSKEYELSKYTIRFQEAQTLENQEDFVLDAALKFMDWVRLGEIVKSSAERLTAEEDQYAQIKKNLSPGVTRTLDLLRAEDSVNLARQTLLQYEAQWKAKQVELATLARYEEIMNMNPVHDIYRVVELPNYKKAFSDLKKRSRLLKILYTLRSQLIYLHDVYVDKSRAQLNLNLTGGLRGSDERFVESLKIQHPDAYVALGFQVPLGGRTMKAEIEKVNLQIEQMDKDIEHVDIYLESKLKSIMLQLDEVEKILNLNRTQIASAKKKSQEEARLYNSGGSDLSFVIQSRDNEQNAMLNYIENAVLYQKLLLHYNDMFDKLFTAE